MAFQGDSIFWVEVEKIVPNPFQPRREFDEQKLQELSESVRMYGILQPLTVTRKEIQREDGTFYTEYELIAGERRLRASKLAGLSQVPVIIREGDDSEQEKLELAIIENLQREDLNAVDRALAFRQLADVFGLSHTQVAKKVGRSREYVSNSIRLLALPDYMQSALKRAEMTEGHARTLLMLNDRPEEQDVVFREILLKKLSVREVERIVRKIATDKVRKKDPAEFDVELIEIEKKFMETLGTRVQIQKTEYGGQLTIDYFSVEDLEAMLNRMKTESVLLTPEQNLAAATESMSKLTEHTPLQTPLDDNGRETADFSDEAILTQSPVAPVVMQSFASEVIETVTPTSPEPMSSMERNVFVAPMVQPSGVQMPMASDFSIAKQNQPVSTPVVPRSESLDVHATVPVPSVTSAQTPISNQSYVPQARPTPVHTFTQSVPTPSPIPTSAPVQSPASVSFSSPTTTYVETPLVSPEIVPMVAEEIPLPVIKDEVSVPMVEPEIPVPMIQPKDDDDSGLYSIRNFTV